MVTVERKTTSSDRPRRDAPRKGGAAAALGPLIEEAIGASLPVRVRFWDGSEVGPDGVTAILVRDPRALRHLLHAPGQVGFARAWVDGSLDVDGDLEDVLKARHVLRGTRVSLGDRARGVLVALRVLGPGAFRPPPTPAIEARLHGRRRSLSRDRHAVTYHYDVSNRFYRLVLGPTMVYSCAYFTTAEDTLEAAQERKLDLICRKLQLAPGDRLLDIGCGWGSLLIHAATHYGVSGVGVTLSGPQAGLARERVADAGVQDRVEIRVQDYRDVTDGPFDKIASVGMYEHVGRDQLGRYVDAVRALLRPGGLFLNHGITRLTWHAPAPDAFISRYVFPDAELHPVTDIMTAMDASELEVRDVESMREHYPMTLRRWCANLAANRQEAIAEAGSQRERVWRLYMLGSALGFEEGDVSIHQVLATRPGAPHRLPLDRGRLLRHRAPVSSIAGPALVPRPDGPPIRRAKPRIHGQFLPGSD